MHLSGQTVTAEQLSVLGWIHDVVPADQLHDRAGRLAEELAAVHSPTQQNLKTLLTSIAELDDEYALDAELAAFETNWAENDVASALRTFLNARSSAISRTDVR